MARDDEIYEIAKREMRAFFPGSFATRADAIRVLLREGCDVKWVDRSSPAWPRCGFLRVREDGGEWRDVTAETLERTLAVRDPAEAWRRLVAAPDLDPELLASLHGRLVDVGPERTRVAIAAPKDVASAIALASAPAAMRHAEELVRVALAQVSVACPSIVWRAWNPSPGVDGTPYDYDRSAFSPLHRPMIDALGYGAWMELSYAGSKLFSFSRYSSDIPRTLEHASKDYGQALQVDAGRTRGLVAGENPFEVLLRIAFAGVVVERVTPAQVVLMVTV